MFGEAQKYKFYVMTEFSCADLVITYEEFAQLR